MVVFGAGAHKRSHTIVAAGQNGRKLAGRTIGTASADHLALLRWAASLGGERRWRWRIAGTCPATWNGTRQVPGRRSRGSRQT